MTVAATIVLGLSIAAIALGVWVARMFGEKTLIESRQPIGLAEARRTLHFDYPESAHDIQFAHFNQWIAFDTAVRFEAPVEDCIAVAERIISADNTAHPGRRIPGLAKIEGKPPSPPFMNPAFRYDWFDVGAIKRGMFGGLHVNHHLMVWVDQDRGVFYYAMTD